ncbi:hypothetical protein R6Q57_004208 [Mikania cordata]
MIESSSNNTTVRHSYPARDGWPEKMSYMRGEMRPVGGSPDMGLLLVLQAHEIHTQIRRSNVADKNLCPEVAIRIAVYLYFYVDNVPVISV